MTSTRNRNNARRSHDGNDSNNSNASKNTRKSNAGFISQRLFGSYARRTAVFATIAIAGLSFAAAGSNAAGFSFVESVKEFFGIQPTQTSAAWTQTKKNSALPLQPLAPTATFTPGNLVVEKIGDGASTLSSTSAAVSLVEYTNAGGAAVQTISLPTSSGSGSIPNALTSSGNSTSEGLISRSSDGQFVVVPGYAAPSGSGAVASSPTSASAVAITGATNASPIVITTTGSPASGTQVTITGVGGNTAANGVWFAKNVNSTTFQLFQDLAQTVPVAGNGAYTSGGTWTAAAYLRDAGRLDSTGAINTTTSTTSFSGGNIRSVTSSNGSDVWMVGSVTGVVYNTVGGTGAGTVVSTTNSTSNRQVAVFNGQLYYSTGAGTTRGIYAVGTGLPTASTTSTNLIATGAASSPYGFAFSTDGKTVYVADDTASAVGGIQKWTSATGAAGSFTLQYTLGTGVASIGARGLTVDFSGANPVIYATSAEGSANRLFKITDTGAGAAASTLATAATNTIFRGVSFAPELLSVTATSPADAATNVVTSSTISVTFNTAVNTSTITTQSVSGACSGSLQVSSDNFSTCIGLGSPAASGGNTIFTATPSSALSNSTTYKIRVTTAAKTATGSPLSATFTQATGFTTAAPTRTWTGTTSTDWHTAGNWSPSGVPVNGDSVIIVSATNQPTTSTTAPASGSLNTVTINPGGTLTLGSGLVASGSITVNSSGTLNCGANTVSGAGTFTLASGGALGIGSTAGITSAGATGSVQVAGTRTFDTGANYTYNGTAAQVTGNGLPATVNNLTISNSAGVSLSQNVAVNGVLTLNNDLTTTTAFILTENGTSSGTGDVIGTVQRDDVTALNPRAFGNPNVQIANGSLMSLRLQLVKSAPGSFSSAVTRTYTVSIVSGAESVPSLRLHYLDSELGTNTGSSLHLWRAEGSPDATWTDQGAPTSSSTASDPNNWIENNPVAGFSSWTLASAPNAPTAVKLTGFTATENNGEVMLQWRSGYEARNLGYNLYREQDGKRVQITPSLVAGSALIAGRQTKLTAGSTYTWYDSLNSNQQSAINSQNSPVTYWLEDVDLNGTRTLHGPIATTVSYSKTTRAQRAELISEVSQRTGSSGVQFTSWSGETGKAGEHSAQQAQLNGAGAAATGAISAPIDVQRQIAGMPGAKLAISKAGWYRVTQAELQAAGFTVQRAQTLQLFRNGVELAIGVSSKGDSFGASDYVEFYGEGLDSPTDSAQTYYLVNGSTKGKRIAVTERIGKATDPAGPQSFLSTIERKERMIYFSGLRNGDAENFFGQIVTSTPVSAALPVSHLEARTSAQLEVVLQGVTSQSHLVHVLFNGTDLGTLNFGNMEHPSQTFSVPAAAMQDGDNKVELSSLGGAADVSLVDVMRLTYTRGLIADNDALAFSVNSQQTRRISGFTNANVRVIDITDANNPAELKPIVKAEGGGYAAYVELRDLVSPHALVAFAAGPARPADSVRQNNPSSWWSQTAGADYVMVTTGGLKTALEPLAQLRRNQGMVVKVIDVEDLYDEFTFGKHSPQALRDFLQQSLTTWTRKPHYLLLAGDASYDPKNYFGQGANDQVPTKLVDTALTETASDDWLADFNNDGIADLAIGRLPVRSSGEINALVGKIVGYENAPPDPTRGALLVADTGFETQSGAVGSVLPTGLTVQTINRASTDDATAHNLIIAGLNQGPRVANYFGHGSNGVWTGAALLSNDDAPALANNSRLSVFTMMTCFNGYFQDAYNESLAEALLKSQGGAVAVWASTTLTEPSGQNAIDQAFYRLLFGAQPATLGDASRAAKASTSDPDVRRTWTLFGDPAMRLR